VTTPDVTVLSLAGSNALVLPEFVKLAHENIECASAPFCWRMDRIAVLF